MMKTFAASFLGCLAALLIVLVAVSRVWESNIVPGLLLMGIAAEKIIGPEESERIVRTVLGREWHAMDYQAGMPTDPRFREPSNR